MADGKHAHPRPESELPPPPGGKRQCCEQERLKAWQNWGELKMLRCQLKEKDQLLQEKDKRLALQDDFITLLRCKIADFNKWADNEGKK